MDAAPQASFPPRELGGRNPQKAGTAIDIRATCGYNGNIPTHRSLIIPNENLIRLPQRW
jgi:hypothetical protein